MYIPDTEIQIPICQYCQKTEEQAKCDILQEPKCKIVICRWCLKKCENDTCANCKKIYHDHKNKFKNNYKQQYMRIGMKRFQKEFAVRKEWEKYPQVSKEMIHLLSFFAIENPNKYDHKYKKQVKEICDLLREERNVIKGVKDYQNIPSKIKEIKNEGDNYNGKEACSYGVQEHSKGIKQILQAFI